MNKREIAEIKRRFKKESCTFTKIAGCYVNSDKAKVTSFRNTFLNLEEDEFYKYLEIANKALSGKPGNNLIELPFPLDAEAEGGAQALLMELRKTRLEDDDVLNRFYDRVIESYDKVENYIILLFHDAYDVPVKTSDNLALDDSEEVYEYIICAICPVDLSKPGLGYQEDENRIGAVKRNWVVGATESAFTFPCFTDRSTDLHAVMCYTKDAKMPHTELWEEVLSCKAVYTATQKKTAFNNIVTESLGDPTDDDVIDTVIDVQSHINSFVEQQKEVLEKDQPVLMEKEDLTPILENSGIEEPIANQIVEKCNSFFEEDFPTAEDILDTKVLKDNSLRMEKNELQEQVVELHHKLREAGITDEEGNEVSVIVKVPDDKEAEVTATFVDGRRCLVIPLDGNEETTINGKHKIF
ncbi:MAG TPA: hypothetical protein DCP96_04135 [Lachnospiraceae bacterium]|jgi:hypothetical protein|nr:DUF4317 domain-containing protein [Lachnospiraceae bacterium]MDY5704702.1 DUF4317 domain-containing protein [Lachnospiraceae bacterium]MEE3356946.1 DUF4317 domain-containing protein [Lachnospiraceae bacterium]HAN50876.1 hypothetical protein [Lachnospiraceae bacterium]HBE08251.1 hypothetical protein [Lachnospiraceae bacterium]